jgi:hypothetical protein
MRAALGKLQHGRQLLFAAYVKQHAQIRKRLCRLAQRLRLEVGHDCSRNLSRKSSQRFNVLGVTLPVHSFRSSMSPP